jgi:hypothetical protein
MQRLTNVANSRTRSDSSKELQPSNQEHYCHAKLRRNSNTERQKVVEAFEQARPGYGKIANQNITSPYTGWAESIADTTDDVIKVETGTASNSFMYRRIG